MIRRVGVGVALVVAGTAFAQQAKPIDVSHPCRTCVLRIERGPRLVDPAGGMGKFPHNLAVIDRDSRGRYWVAVYGSHMNALVFGADGKFIKRIGREGAGPGEFKNLTSVLVGPGDTVHAFDAALKRRSEISPTTLEVVRASSFDGEAYRKVLLANGNFVGGAGAAYFTGHPFEEVDRKGDRVREFGGDGKRSPTYAGIWLSRRVVSDHQGGFYALPYMNYEIEHRDAKGNLIDRWERNAPWFPRSEPVRSRNWPFENRPTVFGAWVNGDGLLFVGTHVRQEGWERAVVQGTCEGGTPCPDVDDYDDYYDSIIEVIDPKTGQLLASIRSDKAFTSDTMNGEMYSRGEDQDAFYDIYRVVFVRK